MGNDLKMSSPLNLEIFLTLFFICPQPLTFNNKSYWFYFLNVLNLVLLWPWPWSLCTARLLKARVLSHFLIDWTQWVKRLIIDQERVTNSAQARTARMEIKRKAWLLPIDYITLYGVFIRNYWFCLFVSDKIFFSGKNIFF